MGTYIRQASHAGSWYSDNPTTLTKDLDHWLEQASSSNTLIPSNSSSSLPSSPLTLRGLIGPHAGYRYAGSTIAYSYKAWLTSLREYGTNNFSSSSSLSSATATATATNFNQPVSSPLPSCIFLFGPSHHVAINGFGISGASEIVTPLGNIPVNTKIIGELVNVVSSSSSSTTKSKSNGSTTARKYIRILTQDEDEDEHSLEMHLPVLKHILNKVTNNGTVTIVPILVGTLPPSSSLAPTSTSTTNTPSQKDDIESLFLPYFRHPDCFFIWSTDFCHWGNRFRYTPVDSAYPIPSCIYQGIEKLDKEGMNIIETRSTSSTREQFQAYLSRTKNTICGRNPLLFMLRMMEIMDMDKDNIVHSPTKKIKNGEISTSSSSSTTSSGNPVVPSSLSVSSSWNIKFLHYNQSSKVTSLQDSSVSYAAGVIYTL